MGLRPQVKQLVPWLAVLILLATVAAAGSTKWAPAEWKDIETLEMLTVGPEEGEHWSKLWLVVIEDQLYVRLGSRAADRFNRNTHKPNVSIRIAGAQFDRVRGEDRPDFADRVAAAMGSKYWSDFLIRLFPHPLTLRLEPEVVSAVASAAEPPSTR
jgi:hypothetical protein